MRSTQLPRAVLLDLDDTIVDDTGAVDLCWEEACQECGLGDDHHRILTTITQVRDWYWSDATRHRAGRLEMYSARRRIVAMAFERLKRDDNVQAIAIADRYTYFRDRRLALLPGAVETVEWFRSYGCRTALLTNGAGDAQRTKIERFGLEKLFDSICVEGELGFGKPDERVFHRALTDLDVTGSNAWMIGDNLAWDIAPAKRLGLHAVWIDVRGRGLPDLPPCMPDRIVRRLAELRANSIDM